MTPRLPGHGLQAEGKPFIEDGDGGWMRFHSWSGVGLCSCGATSDDLDTDSARKAWHRQHKLDVIAGGASPAEKSLATPKRPPTRWEGKP